MPQVRSEMNDTNEGRKRKILRYLGDKFAESNEGFFSEKLISSNCNIEETEVTRICSSLVKQRLLQSETNSKGKAYKIEMDGLVLLETLIPSKPLESAAISKFKEITKKGLAQIQNRNAEIQDGVVEIGKKHKLHDGLYYLVLIDISGSTVASSKMKGSEFHEWIRKFMGMAKEALITRKRNLCVFVKSTGDGALFLFRNFDDILDWKKKVDESCRDHNDICMKVGRLDYHQYHYKTIIHLGEVFFDKENYDANAFGVNMVFKVEKKFGRDEIGITEAVKQIILPEINTGKFKVFNADNYVLDENEETSIPLWNLTVTG
jgi:predicted transcriptional regulator